MTPQHWLVAHRRTEIVPTAPEETYEEEESHRAVVGPLPLPTNRLRHEYTAWMQGSLAEVHGYVSIGEMYRRVLSDPRWFDIEVEDVTERDLSPWRTLQLVRFHAGTLMASQVQEPVSRSDSVLSQYGSVDEIDEDEFFSSGQEIRGSDTPSNGHQSDSQNTPSSAGESDDGNMQLMLRALQLGYYSIEDHTMVLYQDLMSLFRHYTDARESHSGQAASTLANTEMEILMSRYEDSLLYFERSSSSSSINSMPAYLYSGASERIKQSIVYCAYIASDRTYFPNSSFSVMPWSYLGPKTYSASRMKHQRISSDMLMVFQNKMALLREFKSVLWGRRRYLRWLERYPEIVAKVMWMLDPTFTHTRVGLIDSLVETLEE